MQPDNENIKVIDLQEKPKLPLMLRFWQRLGFGDVVFPDFAPGEPPGFAEEKHIIGVTIRLTPASRIRALVSGRMIIRTSIKTFPVVERSVARTNVSILPPGTKIL
jgi:hypothetical protein